MNIPDKRDSPCNHLLLARYDITCDKEDACHIKLSQLRGQLPATRAKYKDGIEACGSLDYIEYNVSQIARRFGLNGTDLGRQLRTHYPGIIEWREKVRKRLGLNDNLSRGTRKGIPYEEGKPVNWSSVRKYNPATAAKYTEAIARLKEGGLTMAKVAAEFGLHPDCFRQ